MKRLAGCVVVLAVPVLVLLGVLWFALGSTDDTSDLTREVSVTVVESRDLGQTFAVDYAYRVEGEWWADDETFDQAWWRPGDAIRACVDPEEPARHAVTVTPGERCGDGSVGGGVHTAEPTSPPG
jgi:hypothetical protein